MRTRDLKHIRNNFGVGNIIKVTKRYSSERSEKVEVEIVAKYPFFCLVQDAIDPKYKWCVSWESLAGSVGL